MALALVQLAFAMVLGYAPVAAVPHVVVLFTDARVSRAASARV